MESSKKRILIAGGYGVVGSEIARQLRAKYEDLEFILAGRNPDKGDDLAAELGNASTAFLDLQKGFALKEYGSVDLIIAAMEDHSNILQEAAIKNGIACITFTELADEVSPVLFLSKHQEITAPVVLAGHWQAGIITLVAKELAQRFSEVTRVEMAGLYDEGDPVGPMVSEQVGGFIGNALIRREGKWEHVEAKSHGRIIRLHDGSSVEGHPMGTLDLPGVAALTNTPNIRFDFATGKSIGSNNGKGASHDLYLDIEGILTSGKETKLRVIISHPEGTSHLTALGVFLIVEGVYGLGEQTAPDHGGIYLPETIVSTDNIISRLKEYGLTIIEEVS